jgi:hypothetical protein
MDALLLNLNPMDMDQFLFSSSKAFNGAFLEIYEGLSLLSHVMDDVFGSSQERNQHLDKPREMAGVERGDASVSRNEIKSTVIRSCKTM